MNWSGPTYTDSGGFPGHVARRRVQEGHPMMPPTQ